MALQSAARPISSPDRAGDKRAAAVYSLIDPAKLSGVDREIYLRNTLPRIADHPATRLNACCLGLE